MKVRILPGEDRNYLIGSSVIEEERVEMLLFLVLNIDVFAWNLYEVPGVDPEFIVHKLKLDPLYPPKKAEAEEIS